MAQPALCKQSAYLRSRCTCEVRLGGSCHLRSFGVLVVDADDEIVSADAEAVEALRGPQEEWDDHTVRVLHDGTCRGALHKYWTFIEQLGVGSSGSGTHHYLVIQRSEDAAVVWMQVCIHAMDSSDGRLLFLWHVRDVSGAARCLEMSRMDAGRDYELSLENDGMPHSRLLTQAPDVRPSSDPQPRTQLADLLTGAVASEGFAVLHLTAFGAVDAVFPRRLLGWGESDVVDRSFVGLLCPEDRAFFCGALRRCHHDGIPQRLVLKIAAADESRGEQQQQAYVACDVTVLLPESVQRPVLVVSANDHQWQQRVARPLQHTVSRMQLDTAHMQAQQAAPVPASSAAPVRAPPAPRVGLAVAPSARAQPKAARSPDGPMLAIPMCDIFAIAARKPPPAALAGSSAETVFGRFSPVGGTFASALERAVMHTSPY